MSNVPEPHDRIRGCATYAEYIAHELGNLGIPMRKTDPELSVLLETAAGLSRLLTNTLNHIVALKDAAEAGVSPTRPPLLNGDLWLLKMAEDRKTDSGAWVTSGKIETIKAVRSITDLGLKEAKDLVESLPKSLGVRNLESPGVQQLLDIGAAVVWR
jgi:hypothetical protein